MISAGALPHTGCGSLQCSFNPFSWIKGALPTSKRGRGEKMKSDKGKGCYKELKKKGKGRE